MWATLLVARQLEILLPVSHRPHNDRLTAGRVPEQATHVWKNAQLGVKLSEFDLKYIPKTSVKGRALADFVKYTISHQGDETPGEPKDAMCWMVIFDGAANEAGGEAGVVPESLEGLITKHALRFGSKIPIMWLGMRLCWQGLRLFRLRRMG